MNRYRNLLKRIAYLESLLHEGKQDQELLLQHVMELIFIFIIDQENYYYL